MNEEAFLASLRDDPTDANFACAALARTCAVGSYPPNALGLHDLHGNVREWCIDRHGNFTAESTVDPQGPPTGWGQVSRGGRWHDPDVSCRSACRHCELSEPRDSGHGFRAVLAPARR